MDKPLFETHSIVQQLFFFRIRRRRQICLLRYIIILVTLFISLSAKTQLVPGDYRPLKAQGIIPDILKKNTVDKIEDDFKERRESMSYDDQKRFLENIHYSIDDLLHSGQVIFGDPVTNYIEKVADNLLKDYPELRAKLKFFTLKSNVSNALSTDQGIILVTTGLLSRIENEAQLAYILSHEIAHYQRKHVEKFYVNKIRFSAVSSTSKKIHLLSSRSKVHEFDADKVGVKLYHGAGYSKDEMFKVFTILDLSDQPFIQRNFPKTYFNSSLLYIPESYFIDTINLISREVIKDDVNSSHPNIDQRVDSLKVESSNYDSWGNLSFHFDMEEFNLVRDYARFGSVRLSLLGSNFVDALFSIFLLEETHPHNLYLTRSKAKAWLGLINYRNQHANVNSRSNVLSDNDQSLQILIRKLNGSQLSTIALRQVIDAQNLYPEDIELAAIYKSMIRVLAKSPFFIPESYQNITYKEALEDYEERKLAIYLLNKDALNTDSDSKYDRINQQINENNASEEFSEDGFHYYALTDVMNDDEFIETISNQKIANELEEKLSDSLSSMNKKEYRRMQKASDYRIDEVILVNSYLSVNYYNNIHFHESSVASLVLSESILKYARKLDVVVHDLSLLNINDLSTQQFNQRMLIQNFIQQDLEYGEINDMFPVDYCDLMELSVVYNDAPILIPVGQYSYLDNKQKTLLVFILFDPKTGNNSLLQSAIFRKPRKLILEGYAYDVLAKLNPKKRRNEID